jgi:uncharacterized iron-regulated membrane protein
MTSPGLVRIHRWVALSLGAFIAVIGLMGSALVFREELTPVFTPAVKISPAPVPAGAYERILAAARRVDPGASPLDIVLPLRADRAAEVIVHRPGSEHYLFVDPHDGAVVADGEREWLPFAAFYELHRRLLSGKTGESLVGLIGFALAFLGVSGLILWWPRKWAYAFRVRWDGNRLAVSYDLHKCAGAAFAVILIVNALIGFAMAFDDAAVALVNAVSGSRSPPPIPAAASSASRPGRSLDEIVAAAERALPEGTVRRVTLRAGDAPVIVRKRLPSDNETNGMNRIYVDAATASILQVRLQRDMPPGNAMFEWLYPLHTGTLIGMPYRFLLVVAGCVPLLSLVTGFIVWRSKARRKQPAGATAGSGMRGKRLDSAG